MKAGNKVRLKSDPSRIGTLTGEEQVIGGRRRLEVSFFDGIDQFCLENALEIVPQEANTYLLFRQGRHGRLRDLRGALTYYRLSGKLANLIYSMDTTNTEFYAYQFKPVLAFLESPNHGLLVADEVGLGKTIEAGLIWTELRSRFDARRLLVICPAILREKWQAELSDRFGVKADICSAKGLFELIQRHRRGDLSDFAVITSMQGIRPPRNWDDDKEPAKGNAADLARLFDELEGEDPIFDLTIIDEAHYLRNPDSQTSKLAGLIRPLSDGLVMLSATPIQLKSDDLYHQVKYLDEATFSYIGAFNWVLESSRPLVELRDHILRGQADSEFMKAKLEQAQCYAGLKDSQQIQYLLNNVPKESVFTDYDLRAELAETIDRINPLSHVITRTRKRDVHERRVVREPHAIRVPMSSAEEQFYWEVTERVRAYCMAYDLREGFLLTIPQRQMTSSMPAACRAWLKKAEGPMDEEFLFEGLAVDEETEIKRANPGLGPLTAQLITIAREVGDYKTLREQDSKFYWLLGQLRSYWAHYPDHKILLFSFYRETLAYLHERLTEESISTMVLQGGMDKHQAIADFKAPNGPRLLLASEVASEGVDLQFCSLLINYDLPWNPQRIEQRIGRIDRIGQKEELIRIWNIFHQDTIDDRVYTRLLDRLDIFRVALGSVESILGEDIRRMTYKLFSHTLTVEQEQEVIEQTTQALANRRVQEERLEEEASHLVAHGDYIQNKVNAARELKRYVTGEDIYNYVRDFFDDEFPGCRFQRVSQDDLIYTIDLSGDAKFEFGEFLRRARLLGKTRLTQATNKMRFLFENRVVIDQSKDEVISQFHPLIRFISEHYKAKGTRQYFPVIGLEISSLDLPDIVPGIYVFAIERWSMKVALRDIERLAYQVFSLAGDALDNEAGERLVNTAMHKGQDWLSSGNEVNGNLAEETFVQCEDVLEEKYRDFVDSMIRENSDRIAFQLSNLDNYFETKKEGWSYRINQMLHQKKYKGAQLWISKLEKLRVRTEDKKSIIRKSETPAHDKLLVSSGVIRVY